jgi:hypothetical protein
MGEKIFKQMRREISNQKFAWYAEFKHKINSAKFITRLKIAFFVIIGRL